MNKLLKILQDNPNRAIYVRVQKYMIALSSPLSAEELGEKYDMLRQYDYSQWNCTVLFLAELMTESGWVGVEYNSYEKPIGGYRSIDGQSVLWFTPIDCL